MSRSSGPVRRFTGYHMTAILIGFFGVIIAVNFTMAYFASSTFGGTVVDNSYVASQNFNEWLERARLQNALGWRETVARDGGKVAVDVESSAGPLYAAEIAGIAHHPLGRAEPVRLTFGEVGDGRYRSRETLPPGRWIVRLEIARGTEHKRLIANVL